MYSNTKLSSVADAPVAPCNIGIFQSARIEEPATQPRNPGRGGAEKVMAPSR